MNNYERIPSFEECKKICNEQKTFSHSTQTIHGQVVHSFKYNANFPQMFQDKEGYGKINIRGITYDSNGKLLALPFPKFFNNGEVEETRKIDINDAVHIAEKMDGSLISFFKVNGILELKTMKSVESDVAISARQFLNSGQCLNIREFSSNLVSVGLSPMFEYISPLHKIVLDYGKEDFVFLGARSMNTGKIYMPNEFDTKGISIPRVFSSETAMEYLEESNVEGLVLTMSDGLMLKMKAERYVQAHRALRGGNHKIINLIMNGDIDDVKGILSKNKMMQRLQWIIEVEAEYIERYCEVERKASMFLDGMEDGAGKKEIALRFQRNDELFGEDTEVIRKVVMKMFDRRDYKEIIDKKILTESKEWPTLMR